MIFVIVGRFNLRAMTFKERNFCSHSRYRLGTSCIGKVVSLSQQVISRIIAQRCARDYFQLVCKELSILLSSWIGLIGCFLNASIWHADGGGQIQYMVRCRELAWNLLDPSKIF